MALHEVVVRQSYFDQEVINRYNYVSTGTPAAVSRSFGLASAMGWVLGLGVVDFEANTVARAVQNIQNDQTQFVDVLVKNVYDPVDFYTTSFAPGVVGAKTAGGEAVSPAVALGFRSARTRLDIKRGFKRYVGVSEVDMNDGGNLAPAFLTGGLANMALKLGDVLEYDDEGNIISYQPVIVSKFRYTTPAGNFAYEYYPPEQGGEAEQLQNVADANVWQPYSQVRTQVSRQYGRGR